MRVLRDVTVSGVERDGSFVRVTGNFSEGGTASKTAIRTDVSFLVNDSDQPRVGQMLTMTIEDRI